jgi:hypothetical protein
MFVYNVSGMCWAYFVVCLFVFMALICSLYQVSNERLLCPVYLSGHSLHRWYSLADAAIVVYNSY